MARLTDLRRTQLREHLRLQESREGGDSIEVRYCATRRMPRISVQETLLQIAENELLAEVTSLIHAHQVRVPFVRTAFGCTRATVLGRNFLLHMASIR